jgi:hypothetical protein
VAGAILAVACALILSFAYGPAAPAAFQTDSGDGDINVNVPAPGPSQTTPHSAEPPPTGTSSVSATATATGPTGSATASPTGGSSGGGRTGSGSGGGIGSGGGGTTGTEGADGGDDGGQCVQQEPALPLEPDPQAHAAATDKDLYLPGNKVTAQVGGFEAGERVQLVLFSEVTLIGNFTADSAGQVEAVFAVADDAAPGTHVVQFTGWCGVVTARADVLVGSPTQAPPSGWPTWVWWLAIALAAIALVLVVRRVVRLVRERAAGPEAPPL